MNFIRSQLKTMLMVEPRTSGSGFRAMFDVSKDFSILPDHFKNAPILPGMCIVQAVLLAGAIAQGVTELRLTVLKNAKLMHPILPGEQVVIEADTTANPDGHVQIRAKIIGQEKRRAEISLIARAVVEQEAILS